MTTVAPPVDPALEALRGDWLRHWPAALAAWSKFTRLSEPRWCLTPEDEKEQHLAESFAMIRLTDQAVVVSLPRVRAFGVERFAAEVLAHEVGHHVYCPGSLLDHGRMLARIRRGLPTKEYLAPLVANLYADLLINDRLQRDVGLDMAGVYRALVNGPGNRLWTLYMRIYEILWGIRIDRLSWQRFPKSFIPYLDHGIKSQDAHTQRDGNDRVLADPQSCLDQCQFCEKSR